MLNKLSYLRSTPQNMRASVSYLANAGQSAFVDRPRDLEKKGAPLKFKHDFAYLCHMHALRLWTITYAPSQENNLKRLQEVHRI